MENIARALEVEIKDLFEFAHLQAGGVKVEEIEKLLEGADEEKSHTGRHNLRTESRFLAGIGF